MFLAAYCRRRVRKFRSFVHRQQGGASVLLYGPTVRYDWPRIRLSNSVLPRKSLTSLNGFPIFQHLLCNSIIARHNYAKVALGTIVQSPGYGEQADGHAKPKAAPTILL